VVSKRNGRWTKAIEVPGLGALNKGKNAQVVSVSCASPGSCVAGGYYGNGYSNLRGAWASAREVAGRLNTNGTAKVASVSCASAGTCAAGGDYETMGGTQGFVVREKNGVWGNAITVPGLRSLSKGTAEVLSVSCAPAGSCVAVGSFQLTGRFAQPGDGVRDDSVRAAR
jgi:hypothetical protein